MLLYFGSLALEGDAFLGAGKPAGALRPENDPRPALEMSRKLTRLPASTLAGQNPGEVAARFSGDVDTVEALFTSGIISMAADACRIISIMAVIAVKNTGIALVLLLVLPLFAVFTRHVQKRMLAAQLDNRRAVAAVSGQVPETLHNIRTIRALGLESYMERRYDRCIGESYAAMERTNFYDAIYSPVVLAAERRRGRHRDAALRFRQCHVLALFGMSVGTSVAIINYISRIFAPIESLGMEIQTIQSAMAGVKRIDAFLAQPERTILCRAPDRCARRCGACACDLRLWRTAHSEGFLHDRKAGGAGHAGGPHRCGQEHGVQAPAGPVSAGGGYCYHRRRECGGITDRERRTCIGCVEQHFSRVPGTVLEQITLGDPQITGEMARNAAKAGGHRQSHPGSAGRVATPFAAMACSRRASGSCCPLPALRRRTRLCCCWTRSRQIWTLKRKPVCWKHCAAPRRPHGALSLPSHL